MFKMVHNNLNVSDLGKSLAFYRDALDMREVRRIEREDFTIVFLEDGESGHQLELTCLRDHPQRYDLGENETHMCFTAEDYDAAHEKHKAMGCICYENTAMGLYFINDPDNHWIEIVRKK